MPFFSYLPNDQASRWSGTTSRKIVRSRTRKHQYYAGRRWQGSAPGCSGPVVVGHPAGGVDFVSIDHGSKLLMNRFDLIGRQPGAPHIESGRVGKIGNLSCSPLAGDLVERHTSSITDIGVDSYHNTQFRRQKNSSHLR